MSAAWSVRSIASSRKQRDRPGASRSGVDRPSSIAALKDARFLEQAAEAGDFTGRGVERFHERLPAFGIEAETGPVREGFIRRSDLTIPGKIGVERVERTCIAYRGRTVHGTRIGRHGVCRTGAWLRNPSARQGRDRIVTPVRLRGGSSRPRLLSPSSESERSAELADARPKKKEGMTGGLMRAAIDLRFKLLHPILSHSLR